MARAASRKNTVEFFPPQVSKYCRQSAARILGLILGGGALFLLLALASYTPTDPSFNTAGSASVTNRAGVTGAYSADILLQSFGLGSYLAAFAIAGLAIQLMLRAYLPRPALQPVVGLLATLSAATAFGAISPLSWLPHLPYAGGLAGAYLSAPLESILPGSLVFLLTITASITGLLYAAGLSIVLVRQGLLELSGFIWAVLAFAGGSLATIISSVIARRPHPASNAPAPAKTSDSKSKPRKTVERPAEEITEKPRLSLFLKNKDTEPAASKNPSGNKSAPNKRKATGTAHALPSLQLLSVNKNKVTSIDKKLLQQYVDDLGTVLSDFGVQGDIVDAKPGPVVTMYELEPAPGIKSSRVISLADDIARSMSAVSARVAVVPGRNVIGIELPNPQREMVGLREILAHRDYLDAKAKLPLALGKDISGESVIVDLAKMPHLLVAGTTGSGKSVSVNTMILSLLYRLTPDQCKFIMVDPKMLELSIYDGIPHLLTPVVTDPKKAVVALKWAVKEMEQRYHLMSRLGVRNIDGYNQRIVQAQESGEVLHRRVQTGFDAETGKPVFEDQPLPLEPLPYIVVIVDEMADLMLVAGKEIEACIQRLAQMARAAGIHLIMATQRPSVDVITGTIKANFPTRISFQVTSKIDSRTILSEQGAEQLLGQGDMLYMAGGGRISRVHGPFVSDGEVEAVVSFLKEQGEPDYIDNITVDEDGLFDEKPAAGNGSGDQMFDDAVQLVLREGKVSTSFIQRHLAIGYNRAARIVDQMEEQGIVSKANATGKREILIS